MRQSRSESLPNVKREGEKKILEKIYDSDLLVFLIALQIKC